MIISFGLVTYFTDLPILSFPSSFMGHPMARLLYATIGVNDAGEYKN